MGGGGGDGEKCKHANVREGGREVDAHAEGGA